MPWDFPTDGLTVVPTGSLGVAFLKAEPLPAEIEVRATNSELVVTTFTDLSILSEPNAQWQAVELTTPLPFGEVYDVQVFFDSLLVYTQSLEVAHPGSRRSPVVRQRIYETLLTGYLEGDIAVEPFGNGHFPSSVNKGFKSKAGLVVEVGAAYIDGISRRGYDTQTNNTVIPLKVYGNIDSSEDTEEITAGLEEVQSYLLQADWRLAGFGVTQSEATYGGSEPEISEDRKMANAPGTVTIPVRKLI